MGTLGYMAPEVLTGGLVDERADIFAVGVMVVETLTDRGVGEGSGAHDGALPWLRCASRLDDI